VSYQSTAPLMKAALLTALTARAGLSGVTVSYGAPTQGPREFIALSDISGTQEFAMLGKLRKDETYTLSVYCSVLREGNMQQTCTERCFELAAEIAQLSTPFSLEEFASDQARQSILTLGVEATERI